MTGDSGVQSDPVRDTCCPAASVKVSEQLVSESAAKSSWKSSSGRESSRLKPVAVSVRARRYVVSPYTPVQIRPLSAVRTWAVKISKVRACATISSPSVAGVIVSV